MSNTQELEQTILGHIIAKPSLFDASENLNTELFSKSLYRKLFVQASTLWEEERTEPLNDFILAERCGVLLSEITKLSVGVYPISADNFRLLVKQLRGKYISGKLYTLAYHEIEQNFKTGAWEWDPEKIATVHEYVNELEGLGQANGNGPYPTTLLLADVKAQPIPWLWRNFIPLGKATLLSGDPGVAKTWFSLDMVARLSRGLPWADGCPGGEPANTYYMTVEDNVNDTIRPRIDSLGGDPSRIFIYNPECPLHINLSTEAGRQRLEREVVNAGNIRLVVVDPIIDFSAGVNPNAGEEVRALLTPLIQMATRQNFALLIIGHLNKAQTMSAIYRAGGSTSGWLGKCRAAFMIFRNIDDSGLRHVYAVKANLAPQDPPQLEYRIIDGRVEIRCSESEVDPEEHIGTQRRGPNPRERESALAWLEGRFAGQYELPAIEIAAAAKRAGISESTLMRAKKAAGFVSIKRTGKDGGACWLWARGPS